MATRLDRLNARRTDPKVTQAKLLNEVHRTLTQSEAVRYVVGAMQPIDPEYTKNTYEQGERVCNQLRSRLSESCEYEYQGSVTNDTHIKAQSDIDILLLIEKFYTLEPPQQPSHPYNGDPLQDLFDLRNDAKDSLEAAFPEATVDFGGSKSIAIEGGSLRRKVDVVPANWFDTNRYAKTGNKIYRGVQILDAKNRMRLLNTPFLHNELIAHKDIETGGGLRKAARLLKSLKYDTESIDLSSYDLVSLAYNMPERDLYGSKGAELLLLGSCWDFCRSLQSDRQKMMSLMVPDGHRAIFADGHATAKGLNQLADALGQLVIDVLSENERSFSRLAEARIEY